MKFEASFFRLTQAAYAVPALLGVPVTCACVQAQQLTPLIAEYRGSASGSFEVTNTSATPSVVLLEGKSFSIALDGTGQFRALDAAIQLDLSATSLRLEPRQSAHIFYKVITPTVPAWLSIYASFTPAHKTTGVNVRVMLPHTIYVYQRQALTRDAIRVSRVRFDEKAHQVICDLVNVSERAGRASLVEVNGDHAQETQGGFPLLPHEERRLAIDWSSRTEPRNIALHFENFDLKLPVEPSTDR